MTRAHSTKTRSRPRHGELDQGALLRKPRGPTSARRRAQQHCDLLAIFGGRFKKYPVSDGRGSPHSGVYLSFQHLDDRVLTVALGPVIDIFRRNNIGLTRQPVEVFPIAHHQMGDIEVDGDMASCVGGLYAAGELVGGANGANRLSGNALPEAMVFGARAGEAAARFAARRRKPAWDNDAARPRLEPIRAVRGGTAQAALLRSP